MTLAFFPNLEETHVRQKKTHLDNKTLKGRGPSVIPLLSQTSTVWGRLGFVFCCGGEVCPEGKRQKEIANVAAGTRARGLR